MDFDKLQQELHRKPKPAQRNNRATAPEPTQDSKLPQWELDALSEARKRLNSSSKDTAAQQSQQEDDFDDGEHYASTVSYHHTTGSGHAQLP
ncbi:hypothetical protein HY312_01935 [Candidatus Saccharibacteria bacterium]|nr:hypothetical protein [Candidatus Saccharibacteria bacterium]